MNITQIIAGIVSGAISPVIATTALLKPTVRVRLDEGAYLPTRAHDTDAGADIRTPCAFTLPAPTAARP